MKLHRKSRQTQVLERVIFEKVEGHHGQQRRVAVLIGILPLHGKPAKSAWLRPVTPTLFDDAISASVCPETPRAS